jgi:hypothetical protein
LRRLCCLLLEKSQVRHTCTPLDLLPVARNVGNTVCLPQMYFSCHRSLISDALLVRGWQVQHITAAGRTPIPHKLTKFAKVEGKRQALLPTAEEANRLLAIGNHIMMNMAGG